MSVRCIVPMYRYGACIYIYIEFVVTRSARQIKWNPGKDISSSMQFRMTCHLLGWILVDSVLVLEMNEVDLR